jgi:hypothetical protein
MKDNDPATYTISTGELRAWMQRVTGYMHIIGALPPARYGVVPFAVELEHEHYPPGTPRNQRFHLHLVEWRGLTWSIVSIPERHLARAASVAENYALKLVPALPVILDERPNVVALGAISERNLPSWEEKLGHPIPRFPVPPQGCHTLEYIAGHPAYQYQQAWVTQARSAEVARVDTMLKRYQSERRARDLFGHN